MKTVKSFFDMSDKEKKEIILKATKDSNKAQKELVSKFEELNKESK